jgi:hypothetical protein
MMSEPRDAPHGLPLLVCRPGRTDWVLSKGCDPQLESKLRFIP